MNQIQFEYWCDYYQQDLNILYETYLEVLHRPENRYLKNYLSYTQFSYLVYNQSKIIYL